MKQPIASVPVDSTCPYDPHGRGEHNHGSFNLWFDDYKTTTQFPRFIIFVDGTYERGYDEDEDGGSMNNFVEARLTREQATALRNALNKLLECQDPT